MGLPVLALSEFVCDDAQLGQQIKLLSAQMNIANHRLLKLIAEFDVRGGWRSSGVARSCAHWLAANCGIAIGAARDKVRELFWFQDKDGMWVIHAKLPPERGQLVVKMLEAVTRPIQEQRQEAWKAQQKVRLQTVARNIKHWADGGETSLENLVTLCRFHHRELHRDQKKVSCTVKMSPGCTR